MLMMVLPATRRQDDFQWLPHKALGSMQEKAFHRRIAEKDNAAFIEDDNPVFHLCHDLAEQVVA